MGFLEKNQRNDEYKPMMMPNIRNINNFIGGKNASYKAYPKNMILDKVNKIIFFSKIFLIIEFLIFDEYNCYFFNFSFIIGTIIRRKPLIKIFN